MKICEILSQTEAFIQIDPREFLTLALPFNVLGGPPMNAEKVQKFSKIQWDTAPMFSIKQNEDGQFQVGLHDGRHRALAAAQKSQPLIVQVVRGRKFARENPEINDRGLLQMVITTGFIITEDGSRVISTRHWNIVNH